MAQLLIRDLASATIEGLKQRAKTHHRSLQGELKSIVEAATKMSPGELKKISKDWHKHLAGRQHSDSAKLLREDRDQ